MLSGPPLDIYAFGIGTEIDRVELSEIASQKEKEQHMFILEEAERIEQVFQEITSMVFYSSSSYTTAVYNLFAL